jgi:hypothetical protein
MKYIIVKHILILQFFYIFFLSACESEVFAPSYQVELPQIPEAWRDILGSPRWLLVWISPAGTKKTLEVEENQSPAIQVLEEWTNPVIAYPFWTTRNIPPDIMRPAGALFPFDLEGDQIRLTWRGGIDATLYLELAAQGSETNRYPYYFNWIRFRELLESNDINETLRQDPWSADWKAIALKTARSGFDRRRIVPLPRTDMLIPVQHKGFWISTSPFAEPLYQEAGTDLSLQVCEKIDIHLSSAGILHYTKNAWILMPWERHKPPPFISKLFARTTVSRFPHQLQVTSHLLPSSFPLKQFTLPQSH